MTCAPRARPPPSGGEDSLGLDYHWNRGYRFRAAGSGVVMFTLPVAQAGEDLVAGVAFRCQVASQVAPYGRAASGRTPPGGYSVDVKGYSVDFRQGWQIR